MNISAVQVFQFMAVLFTGMVAGLFYSYDCSVVKGLKLVDDRTYIQTFQSINKAIQNPYFFISFMGCLLILPVTTVLGYKGLSSPGFYFLVSATCIYCIGVFGVTVACNIPLNEKMAAFSLMNASAEEMNIMRKKIEDPWNTFNSIRTWASVISFGLLVLSCFHFKK